ncbi:MAG TPA: haloacid dehalogenase type II [Dehalococcoidia bacterium]|nr:haloacid dehalogenase type II [Dehalococcoidia bacterium]
MEEAIRALTFDVFGTVVDWRGSIIREGDEFNRSHGTSVDWAAFADAWRGKYRPSMEKVRTGVLVWTNLDALHRMSLNELLPEYGLENLTEAEKQHLNRIWHRLAPWPDAIAGLERLKRRYIIATLSNGNVALLLNMAKQAGLPWDTILSGELARHYKRDREVYVMAADLLGLPLTQVMMVAAHPDDLQAAKNLGMGAALVRRPLEWGPDKLVQVEAHAAFDVVADDFVDLAAKLGA